MIGTGGSAALAGDLYATLRWQLAVLAGLVFAISLGARALPAGWRGATAGAEAFEARGRRVLRVCLGCLWIVDGLLQAQPQMPGSFVQQTIEPALAEVPGWLYRVVDPFSVVWLHHPVAADAVTVWLQIGLGMAVLVGGSGRVARSVLVFSAGWALFVWVVGEQLGGLTAPGGAWLTGAPGAALLYLVASALLLLPASTWSSGLAARLARACTGASLLVGAVLQARPSTGLWTPVGMHAAFAEVAEGGVPRLAAAPITWLSMVTPDHAVPVNAAIVTVVALLGLALLADVRPRPVVLASGAVVFLGWWVGEGFGVFGGMATDPNTGPVLLVLLAAGWPGWAGEPTREAVAARSAALARRRVVEGGLGSVSVAAALSSVVALPLIAAVGLLGPTTARAAVGDSGGVLATRPTPAPDFTLTDQNGRPLSMRDLRGTLTVVAFLDPVCDDSCPVLANELADAVRRVGPQARVSLLAVDVNPSFNRVADVATFTREHGLQDLPGWHFVTGSTAQIDAVLAAYGEGVTVPRVGMIGHPQNLYFVGPDGRRLAVLADSANEDLTSSYVQLIAAELQRNL